MNKKENIYDALSDEALQWIVDNSDSKANILDNLKIIKTKINYNKLEKQLEKRNINLNKFNQNNKERINKQKRKKYEIPPEEFFVDGKEHKGDNIKRKLKKYNLKNVDICECCGISEWNNQPIVMQVHHKDGNRRNNKIPNLAILCPNCHSQTENYTGRNKTSFKEKINYDYKSYIENKLEKKKQQEEKIQEKEEKRLQKLAEDEEHKKQGELWSEKEKQYRPRNKGGHKPTYTFTKDVMEKAIKENNGSIKGIAFNYHVGVDIVKRKIKEFDLEDFLKNIKEEQKKATLTYYKIDGIKLTAGQWANALEVGKNRYVKYATTHTYEETYEHIKKDWKNSL